MLILSTFLLSRELKVFSSTHIDTTLLSLSKHFLTLTHKHTLSDQWVQYAYQRYFGKQSGVVKLGFTDLPTGGKTAVPT